VPAAAQQQHMPQATASCRHSRRCPGLARCFSITQIVSGQFSVCICSCSSNVEHKLAVTVLHDSQKTHAAPCSAAQGRSLSTTEIYKLEHHTYCVLAGCHAACAQATAGKPPPHYTTCDMHWQHMPTKDTQQRTIPENQRKPTAAGPFQHAPGFCPARNQHWSPMRVLQRMQCITTCVQSLNDTAESLCTPPRCIYC
jgi:hypothetical protein